MEYDKDGDPMIVDCAKMREAIEQRLTEVRHTTWQVRSANRMLRRLTVLLETDTPTISVPRWDRESRKKRLSEFFGVTLEDLTAQLDPYPGKEIDGLSGYRVCPTLQEDQAHRKAARPLKVAA